MNIGLETKNTLRILDFRELASTFKGLALSRRCVAVEAGQSAIRQTAPGLAAVL
jgi:hypothetical protein